MAYNTDEWLIWQKHNPNNQFASPDNSLSMTNRYKYLPIELSCCHALGIGTPLLGFCLRPFAAEAIAIKATYWEARCHESSITRRQIKKSGPARTYSALPTLKIITTISEWISNEKISLRLIPAAKINRPDVLTKKFSITVKLLGYRFCKRQI